MFASRNPATTAAVAGASSAGPSAVATAAGHPPSGLRNLSAAAATAAASTSSTSSRTPLLLQREAKSQIEPRTGPKKYVYRTRIPSPMKPEDLPPASTSTGRSYVYRTRVPRRDVIANAGLETTVGNPITRRRGAVKHQKIHVIRGHKLVAKFFRQPTFCAFCKDFLWGFGKQGYQCQACQTAVHKKCHNKLLTKCPESGRESENTIVRL